MRLHRLTVQAFGPYADQQSVDFDELNDAGIFLLAGPTGAGKTSILDAVCFALYGLVPGERHVRGLRSDHAEAQLGPRVELELTLGGRRLRIERSPEWQRPKRRGEGTTTERARGKLFEVGPDGARLLSDRLQEIGHELGPLLGMSAEQFQQVVLLPQGGFSTFLQAGSDERRTVLERLFATQRFARIESWVQDRAGQLRRRAEVHEHEVLRLLSTTAHRAGRDAPDDVGAPEIEAWLDGVLADAHADVQQSRAAEVCQRDEESRARVVLREVEAAHAASMRRTAAQSELAELESSQAEEDDAVARLRRHRRAGSVVALLAPLREGQTRVEHAEQVARRAAELLPTPLDQAGCDAAIDRLQRRLGELEGLRDVVDALADARRRQRQLTAEHAEVDRAVEALTRESAALPSRRTAVVRRLDDAQRVLARRDDCARAHDAAIHRLRAAEQVPAAQAAYDVLQAQVRDAHQRANDARTTRLDLVERRLRGMAAELAGQLVDGQGCQVCGSHDHPSPAPPAPDAVTRQQQDDADAAAQEAAEALDRARADAASAGQQLVLLQQGAAGLDVDGARVEEAAAALEVDRVVRADAELMEATTELDELDERIGEAAARTEEARAAQRELVAQLAGVEHVVAQAQPQVEAVLGDGLTLPGAVAATTAELSQVQAASRATSDLADAQRHHRDCLRRAEAAAESAGFRDIDAAAAAVLDDIAEQELETALEARRSRRAHAAAVLVEAEVRGLDNGGVAHRDVDLAAAQKAVETAARAAADAVADARTAQERHAALLALADQLRSAISSWVPAREQHELADSMSRLVRGTGGDNHLQMRLSSYVLATRLDQVLEAANERLQRMRDSRYTFQRSATAAKARARSGLDLAVLDDWTGEARPPSTLSGGETFKLSLALALGLADVITQESGGLDIDTLFIDEGFGMLDAETLDEVMDCIDDLRSGGRAVGVVSHVTELRARISTQLHVTPTRQGSSISLATSPV